MSNDFLRILIVDDDHVNRQILVEYLEDQGYAFAEAVDGCEAMEFLKSQGTTFHAVLLDRMMPKMDGMAVLAQMQEDKVLRTIPVIMQTAAGSPVQIREGIEAGVFYYLTKPYSQEMLLEVVGAAIRKARHQQQVQEDLERQSRSIEYLQSAMFKVRTLEEVHNLSVMLASACPEPEKVVMGLNDILVNAVEHGNLQISYDLKTQLQEEGQWEEEIRRRLEQPENAGKYVEVKFIRYPKEIHVQITDQGEGFDWKKYEEMNPDLALCSHGRGIAMAKALCFDRLEYQGVGNEVRCVIAYVPGKPLELVDDISRSTLAQVDL